MKPALTREGWEVQRARGYTNGGPAHRHKVAAICLYGQPFGFTREDVKLLRKHFTWDVTCDVPREDAKAGTSLADRIEALLPPEDL